MRLNQLKPAAGAKHAKKRLGRGIGSGTGKSIFIILLALDLTMVDLFNGISHLQPGLCGFAA